VEKGEYVFRSSQVPRAEKLVRGRKKCLKQAEVPTAALERTLEISIARKQVNRLEAFQDQNVFPCGYF